MDEVAQKAVEAVRTGQMPHRQAAAVYGASTNSIRIFLNGSMGMNSRVGPATILTTEEANVIENVLLWVSRRHLRLWRADLVETVRVICNDSRKVPWNREVGTGRA